MLLTAAPAASPRTSYAARRKRSSERRASRGVWSAASLARARCPLSCSVRKRTLRVTCSYQNKPVKRLIRDPHTLYYDIFLLITCKIFIHLFIHSGVSMITNHEFKKNYCPLGRYLLLWYSEQQLSTPSAYYLRWRQNKHF